MISHARDEQLEIPTLGDNVAGVQNQVTFQKWTGTDFIRGGGQPPISSAQLFPILPVTYNDTVHADQLKQQAVARILPWYAQSFSWGPMLGQGFLANHPDPVGDFTHVPFDMATGIQAPIGNSLPFAYPARHIVGMREPLLTGTESVLMPMTARPPPMLFGGEDATFLTKQQNMLIQEAQRRRARGETELNYGTHAPVSRRSTASGSLAR